MELNVVPILTPWKRGKLNHCCLHLAKLPVLWHSIYKDLNGTVLQRGDLDNLLHQGRGLGEAIKLTLIKTYTDIDTPNRRHATIQRIVALAEVILVCTIARQFGTSDGSISAILLLLLHRRGVLIQMVKSLTSWRSRLRSVTLFTVIIWIWILVLPYLLSLADVDPPNYSFYADQIKGQPATLLLMLLKVWTAVAFGEEVLGRVFFIDRFETIFKGIPGSMALSVVLASALFGVAHSYQGLGGIILAATIGLLMSAIYVYQKRTIWTNILIHGAVDTIALLLVFFDIKF